MPGDCAPGLVITANTQLRLISLFPLSHIQRFVILGSFLALAYAVNICFHTLKVFLISYTLFEPSQTTYVGNGFLFIPQTSLSNAERDV